MFASRISRRNICSFGNSKPPTISIPVMRRSQDFSDWPGLVALRSTTGRGSFGIARAQFEQSPQLDPEAVAHTGIPEEKDGNYTVEEAIESLGFGRCENIWLISCDYACITREGRDRES